ncbi:MAG: D-glycero-beta-D-manno-heptose 1-phosphate adenylyltransferase [Candidatus Omnitrophota bacterium]
MTSKIKTIRSLKRIVRKLRKHGKTIVFTNGCFDLLHAGHIKYLEEAKRRGDVLIVALNSDASVRRIKGVFRPLVPQGDRLFIVAALASVDYVCLFGQDTPIKAIRETRPDVLIKGADWKDKEIVGAGFVRSYGGKVQTGKLLRGRSTTSLIKKIVKASRL